MDQDLKDRVGLVGCVKQQAAPAAAQDLFVSPLFHGRRVYVERTCGRWYVLSALHGLVAPGEELAPYDLKLKSLSQAERRAWSERVLTQLEAELGALDGLTFEIHAGASYTNEGLVRGLRARGAAVELPAAGLGEAQELAFYHEANSAATGGAGAGSADAADASDEDAEAAQAAHAAFQAAEAAAIAAGAPTCTAADVEAALEALATAAQAVPAGEWPPRLVGEDGSGPSLGLDGPGLHSWWVDKDGAADLSQGLGAGLAPGRIYLGQAGGTRWPAGKKVATTLVRQIGETHLGGRVRASDLRFSLAAALFGELGLQVQAPMLITPASEVALSAWVKRHLAVAVHPVADADALESLERRLLIRLDPPLALLHMPPSPVRARLCELRRVISRA